MAPAVHPSTRRWLENRDHFTDQDRARSMSLRMRSYLLLWEFLRGGRWVSTGECMAFLQDQGLVQAEEHRNAMRAARRIMYAFAATGLAEVEQRANRETWIRVKR